jgi:glycopeptide antibiotics resistance protein
MPVVLPSRSRRVYAAALILYLSFLAFVLLQPQPSLAVGTVGRFDEWLAAFGAPPVLTVPGRVEMVLNAVMFAPAAALASLTWPQVHWANWVAYGFIGSGLVELVQGVILPARSAEFVDVVANTTGALVGALLALAVRRRRPE